MITSIEFAIFMALIAFAVFVFLRFGLYIAYFVTYVITTASLLTMVLVLLNREGKVDFVTLPTVPVPVIVSSEDEDFGEGEGVVKAFFTCPICRHALFFPVVLLCGHALCYLCCLGDMTERDKSCPTCRARYYYVPKICHLLHFLMLRYHRRQHEGRLTILEDEEERTKIRYPRVDDAPVQQFNDLMNGGLDVTEDEFKCTICGSFLYRPVALYCGHVFCKDCILVKDSGEHQCPLCKRGHRESKLMECFSLKGFFDFMLPSSRKAPPIAQASTSGTSEQNVQEPGGTLCHICGKFPIRGPIYECEECVMFYVCGQCESEPYDGLPGFNGQKHTGKHHLRQVV